MRSAKYLPARGEAWQKARMRALVRDNFTCQAHKLNLCSEPCIEDRLRHLQVHHIKSRINGGTHHLDNLLTLCEKHHAQLHPWMRTELPLAPRELEGYPLKEL